MSYQSWASERAQFNCQAHLPRLAVDLGSLGEAPLVREDIPQKVVVGEGWVLADQAANKQTQTNKHTQTNASRSVSSMRSVRVARGRQRAVPGTVWARAGSAGRWRCGAAWLPYLVFGVLDEVEQLDEAHVPAQPASQSSLPVR